ncbi:MAG: RHS repeat-associated core domain-containing protein [Candidatus Omnitrophota bacterium]|nr:RHS repeat-associated core domain-containing protein [Candidatus Omnitrophota bacterium]
MVHTSNPSSARLNSYAYDSFGNIITTTGSTPNNRQFLTKEQDTTGFVYFGARYYDPRIGRFITPDPLGMIDGPNMYLYCKNDPVNAIDPLGLWVALGNREAAPGGYHTVIILHPDNPNDFVNDPRFHRNSKGELEATLSANPNNKPNLNSFFGNLVANPTNFAPDRTNNLKNIQRILDPKRRSDSQLINDFLSSAGKYKDNLPYDPTPWSFDPFYNSNSYTSGIILDVGCLLPNLHGWEPGADKPIRLNKK